jgi:hypothetical protein
VRQKSIEEIQRLIEDNNKTLLSQFNEAIRSALTVKVRYEQVRDPETGQPLATPKIEVKDIYLPDHWVEMLPYLEGALRGVQETTDHVKNKVDADHQAIEAMANLMIASEKSIKALAQAGLQINGNDRQALAGIKEDTAR